MRISFRRTTDWWSIGWAPVAALALYLLVAALAQWAAMNTGAALPVCRFKLLTGIPCPSCGATRAAFALLAGHLAGAWHFNPLLTCAYLIAPLWVALRYLGRRPVLIEVSRPARWGIAALFALAVMANWAYLIASGV